MKKAWLTLGIAAAVFLIVRPAEAALVGRYTGTGTFTDFINAVETPVDLYDLQPAAYTPLNTSLPDAYGRTTKRGSYIYYTNTTGFIKQAVGSSTATTIKKSSKLKIAERFGDNILISSKSVKGEKTGSFIYNTKTKKTQFFTPPIGEITGSYFTKDGKVLVLIAKNAGGRQKIFTSKGTLNELQEQVLPQYATGCTTISISPDGTMLLVGCKYDQPKKIKGQTGNTIYLRSNNKLTVKKTTVDNVKLVSSMWLTATRLVTIEDDANKITTINQMDAKLGKITNKKKIDEQTSLDFNGEIVDFLPIQVQRLADDKFYYTDLFASETVDSTLFGTIISYYDTTLNVSVSLVANGKIEFMTEAR